MKKGLFIQSNRKQMLGAKLAKYAFLKNYKGADSVPVEIILVEEREEFRNFIGKTYLRNGSEVTYDPNDLQSFTLSRFMPPELMSYVGRAVVIDPDIFSIKDISPLFEMDLKNSAIAACSKKDSFDSSVMVLNCEKLKHWNVGNWLKELEDKKIDYSEIMNLKNEKGVYPLGKEWNDLDHLDENTKMLHTTGRLTQPWKSGLRIDFTRGEMPKYFGIIPREPILKLLGRYPSTYQKHPNEKIDQFFFKLLKEALQEKAVTEEEIKEEIKAKNVRADIFEKIKSV